MAEAAERYPYTSLPPLYYTSSAAEGLFFYTRVGVAVAPKDAVRIRIDPSVHEIGERAFSYCRALKDIQLSDGVEIIQRFAFDSCTALT